MKTKIGLAIAAMMVISVLSVAFTSVASEGNAFDNLTDVNETITEANKSINTNSAANWTFMVYLDGDNNLEDSAIDDLNEMELAGSTDEVNIIVLLDLLEENGSWVYYVTHDEDMDTINSSVILTLSEANMGDPETLIWFANWSVSNYPAENYALVLWNHGSGWKLRVPPTKGVCWDHTNGNDHLTSPELQYALSSIQSLIGRDLDIIGFDACLMGMEEIDYLINASMYSAIRVGSEEIEPGEGWPYDNILINLTANSSMTPEELGEEIVRDYIDYYRPDWGECSAEYALQSNIPNPEGKLDSLREFRDTALDKDYVDLYYKYSPEIKKVLAENPLLSMQLAKLIMNYMPSIEFLIGNDGKDMQITEKDVVEATSFIERLKKEIKEKVDEPEASELIKLLNEFEHHIKKSEGKTFSEAFHSSVYCGQGGTRAKSNEDVTQSAVYVNNEIDEAIDEFVQAIMESNDRISCFGARGEVEEMDDDDYIDLYHFAYLVQSHTSNSTVSTKAQNLMDAINTSLIAEGHGPDHPNVHGISIYFPRTEDEYSSNYESDLNFAADTQWDEFLDWFYAFSGPDTYEPDNTMEEANWIQIGETQLHNFYPSGDHNWMKFNATEGKAYIIETSNLGPQADTVMYLYDGWGNEIEYDDDGGEGLASKIVWRCQESGVYYIMIRDWGDDDYGADAYYCISVTEVMPEPIAILSLTEYNGDLYAGVMSELDGTYYGQVYRIRINSTLPRLYAGTSYPAGIWRYTDGAWELIQNGTLVGNNLDQAVTSLVVWNGNLYAGTSWNGMKLYRYDGENNWTEVLDLGYTGIWCMQVWDGILYLGDYNSDTIWRYDGVTAQLALDEGRGCIWDFENYNGNLYASAWRGYLYKSGDGINWNVYSTYPYDIGEKNIWDIEEFRGYLYAGTDAGYYGYNANLYRYDGISSTPASIWTTPVNYSHEGILSMETDGTYLYIGMGGDVAHYNSSGIGKVYRYDGANIESISGTMGSGVQVLYYVAGPTEVTTVNITPPTQEVLSNESFIVNVTVDPAIPIAGVQFDLSFNSSLVTANSVTEGNLLSQGGANTYFSPGTIDNTAGTITGVAGAITTPGQTVSSPGVFATIQMTAKSVEGTSLLDLSSVIVGDINGNPVSVMVSDGSVTVTLYPDWDVNCDGHVNVLDMIRVGQHWGETGTPHWIREDVNRDGSVNVLDMILIGQHWTG